MRPEKCRPDLLVSSRGAGVLLFVAAVIAVTTVVIVAVHGLFGSWATGGTAGVIAGVVSVVAYPLIIRSRRRP